MIYSADVHLHAVYTIPPSSHIVFTQVSPQSKILVKAKRQGPTRGDQATWTFVSMTILIQRQTKPCTLKEVAILFIVHLDCLIIVDGVAAGVPVQEGHALLSGETYLVSGIIRDTTVREKQ